ncbi:MAG: DUF3106 domain-containing protein [Porticoccaceae bacterium]
MSISGHILRDLIWSVTVSIIVIMTAYSGQAMAESRSIVFGPPSHARSSDLIFFAEHQHRRFEELPPEQQEHIRKRREKFESLSPEEREKIRRARERFRNLSPEQRDKLREKWKKMTPEQREALKRDKREKQRYRSDWT